MSCQTVFHNICGYYLSASIITLGASIIIDETLEQVSQFTYLGCSISRLQYISAIFQ